MKTLLTIVSFYLTFALTFFAGYYAWKIDHRYESGKSQIVITGKVNVFAPDNKFGFPDQAIAILDEGDDVKIVDFYDGTCGEGGMEVQLSDGRSGYIHYSQPEENYRIVKKTE